MKKIYSNSTEELRKRIHRAEREEREATQQLQRHTSYIKNHHREIIRFKVKDIMLPRNGFFNRSTEAMGMLKDKIIGLWSNKHLLQNPSQPIVSTTTEAIGERLYGKYHIESTSNPQKHLLTQAEMKGGNGIYNATRPLLMTIMLSGFKRGIKSLFGSNGKKKKMTRKPKEKS